MVSVQVPPQSLVTVGVLGQAQALAAQLANCGQVVPQAPQLRGSVAVLMHAVPHVVEPAAHMQAPAVQTPPLPQLVPQTPQLVVSVLRSTHLPPHSV